MMYKFKIRNFLKKAQELKDVKCRGAIKTELENDRYPFYYPRDSIRAAMAYDTLKMYDRTNLYYQFIRKIQSPAGEWGQRYNCNLQPEFTRPRETDCMGLVLTGIAYHYHLTKDKKFLNMMWPSVLKGLKYLKTRTPKNSALVHGRHSIHESREVENGYEIWTNSWVCRAYRDLSLLAKETKRYSLHRKLNQKYKDSFREIQRKFWNGKTYLKVIRADGTKSSKRDISMISPAWVGIIPGQDARMKKTLRYLKPLWDKKLGGYQRFKKFETVKDWHWYDGGGGPWTLYTIVMARLHADNKQISDAQKCFKWLAAIHKKFGSFPEHIALQSEYLEWEREEWRLEVNMTPWLKQGINNAKKNVTNWRWNGKTYKVVPWVKSIVWPEAELVLNHELYD